MPEPDPIAANVAICEALGLDANRIRRGGVTITLGVDGPIVTVEYKLYDSHLQALLTGLQRYKLVPE